MGTKPFHPRTILLVENDKNDYRFIKRHLEHTQLIKSLSWAQSGEEALQLIQENQYEIILIDYLLGDMDGLALFEKMRQKAIQSPVIFITGNGNERTAVRAIKRGVQDYIVKDLKGEYLKLLPAVINKACEHWQIQLARYRAEQELQQQYQRTRALADLVLSINQPHELQHVLYRICQITTRLLPAKGGTSVILWDEETETFTDSASTVPEQPANLGTNRVRRSGGATRWIVDNQKAVITPNIFEDPFNPNPMLIEYGLRAYAGVPLLAEGKSLGVLYAMDTEIREFSESDVQFLQSLADRAALAITKVSLYDQLQEHAEILEKQNDELNAFSHTVAHDLKAPLALIVGYASLLEKDYAEYLEPALTNALKVIAQTGFRMRNIINELLLLASIRQEDIQLEPLPMSQIVADALDNLKYLEKEFQPEFNLPDKWPTVKGHPAWIEQVWVNYLSNGIKYGGTPPKLQLGYDLEGEMVRFWVKDNGRGLTDEEKTKLFTPFTQLHHVRVKGHGLGLSIVQRIIEKCGGQVGVKTAVNQGSTFWFTLPNAPETIE